MRPFGNKRTHTKDGQELSDFFIGDDGTLSVYFKDEECEIIGFGESIHTNTTIVKPK